MVHAISRLGGAAGWGNAKVRFRPQADIGPLQFKVVMKTGIPALVVPMLCTLVIGVALLFVVSPTLLAKYVASAPRAADVASGHVHAFNQHGVVVYLSMAEQLLVGAASGFGIVALGVCGMLLRKAYR